MSTFNYLLTLVSSSKQYTINRFHFDIDKKLSLYGELVVRVIACHMLGTLNEKIEFCRGEYGKPFLKNYPNFHYNISHTRNAIAIAVSEDVVGVDIEKLRKAELQIADRFFTVAEQDYIKEFKEKTDKRFYEIWTKKEAYIKCIGKGLCLPLNSFNSLDEIMVNQIQSYEMGKYIISVCSKCQHKKFKMTKLNENQVESMFISLLR